MSPPYVDSTRLTRTFRNPADTSIRENILFGEDFDEERYNETIFACALEDDLEAMPLGDETRVGEKGLSMSG